MIVHRAMCGAPLALALLLTCGSGLGAPPQPPRPPPPPTVDDEFLEFLGSVDSEVIKPEDLWLVDYWSMPDPGRTPPPAPAKPAPPDAKPSVPPAGTNNHG